MAFDRKLTKMAANDERNQLTDQTIAILADKISNEAMQQLAMGYLGIPHPTVENARREDPVASNRELLLLFRNRENDILVSICSLNRHLKNYCDLILYFFLFIHSMVAVFSVTERKIA